MKIKISGFCNLSRAKPWQEWLKSVSNDLFSDLSGTIKSGSCRANTNKMVEIYNKLYKTGFGDQFELFMKTNYPYLIELDSQTDKFIPKASVPQIRPIKQQIKIEDINGIFKNYVPNLLTFPHRIIFKDSNIDNLKSKILKFSLDKTGVDYIIIGDLGYIEYFESQYSDVVNKIDVNKREIAIYRKKNAIPS